MSKPIAFLSIAAALLAGSVLPAAAADLYGYEGGGPPLAFHSRDDVFIDGDRARLRHSQEVRPAGYGAPRDLGPVVFDERGPERGYAGAGPAPVERPLYGIGGPPPYRPRFARPYPVGAGYGYGPPPYRPVGFAGPAYGEGGGGPDGGCTTEQARSITPAGWQKTVTYRTCYRR